MMIVSLDLLWKCNAVSESGNAPEFNRMLLSVNSLELVKTASFLMEQCSSTIRSKQEVRRAAIAPVTVPLRSATMFPSAAMRQFYLFQSAIMSWSVQEQSSQKNLPSLEFTPGIPREKSTRFDA